MRGEQATTLRAQELLKGSSPRARGTDQRIRGSCRGRGIIPACAGNSAPTARSRCWCWDHPRVRGEQDADGLNSKPSPGSSPRARGTGLAIGRHHDVVGIIPACAGNSCSSPPANAGSRDHPRVRGEQCLRLYEQMSISGSSPRARGTVQRHLHGQLRGGIIPACAGNSSAR